MDYYSFISELPLLPLLERSFEGVALARPSAWQLIYVNPKLASWLNRPVDETRPCSLDDILLTTPRSKLLEAIAGVWQGTAHEATISGELLMDRGRQRHVDVQFVRIAAQNAPLLGILVREAETARPEATAASEVRRDPLTGLHDRGFLLGRLEALLCAPRAVDDRFAVLFVDLDDFKQVNDAYGHLTGDGVLREVASRLSECVREGDYVARYGGDEFVVLIERVVDWGDVQPVVDRIHAALEKPIALPQGEVRLSVSVGVAESSPEYGSPEDLLAAADRAMYTSKRLRP
jgi:diguanylate cyclase (GGDEF)-like protein